MASGGNGDRSWNPRDNDGNVNKERLYLRRLREMKGFDAEVASSPSPIRSPKRSKVNADEEEELILNKIRRESIHSASLIAGPGFSFGETSRVTNVLERLANKQLIKYDTNSWAIEILKGFDDKDDIDRGRSERAPSEEDELENIERARGREPSIDNSMNRSLYDLVADGKTPDRSLENDGHLPRIAIISPMVPPPMMMDPPPMIVPPPSPMQVVNAENNRNLVDGINVQYLIAEGQIVGLQMLPVNNNNDEDEVEDEREEDGDQGEGAAAEAAAIPAAAAAKNRISCRIRGCTPRKKCPTNQKRDSHEKCAHGYACRLPTLHFVDFFEKNRKDQLKQLERDGFFIFEEFRGTARDREDFVDATNRYWRFFVFVGPNREIDEKITEVNLQLREKEFEEIQFVQTDHGKKYIKNDNKSKKAMLAFVQG